MSKSSVIVVGAGIFGLSTALHLAEGGYDVTVLDQYDYESNAYSPTESSNAASVDHNKIFRASYGKELLYQRLAYESRDLWCQWNEELRKVFQDPELATTLPKSLAPDTVLFYESGMLRVQPSTMLSSLEKETLANMSSEGLRATQYIRTDSTDRQRAEINGWIHKLFAFSVPSDDAVTSESRSPEGKFTDEYFEAVLDSTAGFVLCSKACAFALWKARRAGVKFVLGPAQGKFKELIEEELPDGHKKAIGVRTANDVEHKANLIIIASGPHSHVLLPPVASHIEATCGNVATILIPPDQKTLWDKYSPTRFPVLTWQGAGRDRSGRDAGSIYVLPRTEEGLVKIGYRGVKYTNFQTVPPHTKPISLPLPPEKSISMPLPALQSIKYFVSLFMPDLADLPIHHTRLCWYTDSIDNSFVIDFVPAYEDKNVLVCTGGSGHGAKFLPVLGKHVRNVVEGKTSPLTDIWRWRPDAPRGNGLDEGPDGPRVIDKFTRNTPEDLKRAGL